MTSTQSNRPTSTLYVPPQRRNTLSSGPGHDLLHPVTGHISITKTYMRDIRLLIRLHSVCLVCSDLFPLRAFISDSTIIPRAKIRLQTRLHYRLNPRLHHCHEISEHCEHMAHHSAIYEVLLRYRDHSLALDFQIHQCLMVPTISFLKTRSSESKTSSLSIRITTLPNLLRLSIILLVSEEK